MHTVKFVYGLVERLCISHRRNLAFPQSLCRDVVCLLIPLFIICTSKEKEIAKIRCLLTLGAAERLTMRVFVLELDFCNNLFIGLRVTRLKTCPERCRARLLTGFERSNHITPILYSLVPIQVLLEIQLTFSSHSIHI